MNCFSSSSKRPRSSPASCIRSVYRRTENGRYSPSDDSEEGFHHSMDIDCPCDTSSDMFHTNDVFSAKDITTVSTWIATALTPAQMAVSEQLL